jgi:hypothetical protein
MAIAMEPMEKPVVIDVTADTTCTDLCLPLGAPGEKGFACSGCRNCHEAGGKGNRSAQRQKCEHPFTWEEKNGRQRRVYEQIESTCCPKGSP